MLKAALLTLCMTVTNHTGAVVVLHGCNPSPNWNYDGCEKDQNGAPIWQAAFEVPANHTLTITDASDLYPLLWDDGPGVDLKWTWGCA